MNMALGTVGRTASNFLSRHWHRQEARSRQRSTAQLSFATMHLAHNEVIKHRVARGARIRCESGVVWLTLTDDTHDYILRTGQELLLQGRGELVAQGLSQATLTCVIN